MTVANLLSLVRPPDHGGLISALGLMLSDAREIVEMAISLTEPGHLLGSMQCQTIMCLVAHRTGLLSRFNVVLAYQVPAKCDIHSFLPCSIIVYRRLEAAS